MNENNGFIVIHRKLLEWKYAQFPYAVALWVYLILKANWKPSYFLGVEIPRGSLATSLHNLADATGMEVHTVRKWLKRFEEEGQITRKSTNRFTIINITNYAAFQDIPDDWYSKQDSNQSSKQDGNQDSNQSSKQSSNNRTNKQSNKNNKETNKQIKDSLGAGSFEKNNFPDLKDVAAQVSKEHLGINPEKFFNYYDERGWTIDGEPVRDWKKLLRSWARKELKEMLSVKIDLPEHFTNNSQSMERGPIDYSTMPGGEEDDLE